MARNLTYKWRKNSWQVCNVHGDAWTVKMCVRWNSAWREFWNFQKFYSTVWRLVTTKLSCHLGWFSSKVSLSWTRFTGPINPRIFSPANLELFRAENPGLIGLIFGPPIITPLVKHTVDFCGNGLERSSHTYFQVGAPLQTYYGALQILFVLYCIVLFIFSCGNVVPTAFRHYIH